MDETNASENKRVENWLRIRGFDLFAVMDPARWPEPLRESFRTLDINLPMGTRIVLLGSVGRTLWEIVRRDHWQDSDPIDRYSIRIVEELRKLHWHGEKIEWLHPGPCPIPIQRLCRQAGWSHPSLLGLDIHAQFGTWFACRAVIVVSRSIECTPRESSRSPCESCLEKPCRSHCPSGAVTDIEAFGLMACGSYRLAKESNCAHLCLSRLACPIGTSQRYSDVQLDYHGALSLTSLQAVREQAE
ncbi:MAG TPA: hypothetical protein EYM44_00915 [Gammaproteobacteria bacterium]|nr:hypothetical protein [Gammaproteobacteria bacterium]